MVYATLAEVLAAYNTYAPTAADLTAWKTATTFAAGDKVVTKIGLFGADLTKFNEDCALTTAGCTVADYADYNGWAIGIQWDATGNSATTPFGVVFDELKTYIEVIYTANAATAV